ncbi:hypothetical protein GXB85_07170 [Cellulomonas sp. APG4]|nr:hypothetical protein [Cellulomonas sp. APG4]
MFPTRRGDTPGAGEVTRTAECSVTCTNGSDLRFRSLDAAW